MKLKNLEEDTTKKGIGKKLWLWIGAASTALGIVVGIVMNTWKIMAFLAYALTRIDNLLFDGRITSLLRNRPHWFLAKFGFIFGITTVAIAIVVLLWELPFTGIIRRVRAHGSLSLSLKLIASICVSFLLTVLTIGLTADSLYRHGRTDSSEEVAVLCPQCKELGTCAIRTYASNGMVHYLVDVKGEPGGPRGHARITLQAHRPDVEHGSGWVIFLPRGSDLSSFKQLRFLVRGARGGERIGVKVKDAQGTEVPVLVNGRYVVGAGGITGNWNEVSIPFEDFPLVDFGLMDNFSIYVNGQFAGTEPQTIYVGGFEWR